MDLTGYRVESNADASGGALISRLEAVHLLAGVATVAFPGPAGTYEIIVSYFDESDGQSTLALTVNGAVMDTWIADADLPSGSPDAVTLAYRVGATGVPLAPGDIIALQGSEQGSEFACLDKVEFMPTDSLLE